MVLDVKAMTWAGQQDLDTAKLKAAKVPVYGKWYFPEIPANVPLVNLDTGERRTFPSPMVAGEVLWVREIDLRRAGLGGLPPITPEEEEALEKVSRLPEPEAELDTHAAHVEDDGPEPLILMNRVPGMPSHNGAGEPAGFNVPPVTWDRAVAPVGPAPRRASLGPLFFAIGVAVLLAGFVSDAALVLAGLVWFLAGLLATFNVGPFGALSRPSRPR